MKVLHVIPSLSPKHGGPSFALPLMARSLALAGVTVDVATTDDDGPGCRINVPPGRRIERDGYGLYYFPKQTEFYKVSFPFKKWLDAHVSDYDAVHVHALFSYSSNTAARMARRHGVPYLIRPLGVLNRWGLENRRPLLKSLSLRFVERSLLRAAAAMHYTSLAEKNEAGLAGATAPGAVIPLGIDAEQFAHLPGVDGFLSRFPQAGNRKLILFLSRLDAKKGLDLLLPAYADARKKHPETMLVIAGDGNEQFVQNLQETAARLGLTNDVLWTGFLEGDDKLSAFAAAHVFVLPSYSENFGIVIAEAIASGLPVIATRATPWEELETHRCGWWIDAGVEPLKQALCSAMMLNDAERKEMGRRGKKLIEDHYSWPIIARKMCAVYEWLLGGPKPECIISQGLFPDMPDSK